MFPRIRNFFLVLSITMTLNFSLNAQSINRNLASISYKDSMVKAELYKKKIKGIVKSDREYSWFSHNSIHATQGGYDGILLHGLYRSFYNNNNLLMEGRYFKGLKTGVWIRWNQHGKIIEKSKWKQGLRNGETILYDAQGQVREIRQYRSGKQYVKASPAKERYTIRSRINYFIPEFLKKSSKK
jgi:antitoxin component YwqK of YwqJK toxin-antitoxin module